MALGLGDQPGGWAGKAGWGMADNRYALPAIDEAVSPEKYGGCQGFNAIVVEFDEPAQARALMR